MSSFMIANSAGQYIRHDKSSNKYVPVNGKSYGTVWQDRLKAANIRGTLPAQYRSMFQVVEVDDIQNATPPAANRYRYDASTDSMQEKSSASPRQQEVNDTNVLIGQLKKLEDWKPRIDNVIQFIQEVNDRVENLRSMLATAEQELCDLNHHIEFNRLNAYQGYLVYKKIRGILQRRREIKDEMHILNLIKGNINSTEIQSGIDNISNQYYVPRVDINLFQEGIQS